MRRRAAGREPSASSTERVEPAARASSPFVGLRAQLRSATQPAPQAPAAGKRIRQTLPQPETQQGDAALDEADLELFRKAAGTVQPVRGGGRVEIARPRPAPLPRRTEAPDAAAEPPSAPHTETDPLRLAYQGVMPLRDSGRVELDTPLRHTGRQAGVGTATRIQRPDAIVLPPDADLSDPSALFRSVIGDARPVADRNRVELVRAPPQPAPLKREEDERAALDESLAAPLSFEDRLDMGEEAAFLRPGLPRRVLTDLRRGRWVLQGQIDLHGLTRDEARSALAHFLHDALAQGKRCIRVIHGKGHGSPGKVSILKQLSRGWLAQREEILCFCQAGPHDGGGGALLVLLRAQNAGPR